ncbi:phosphatase PAP2 family protein [Oricola sp.]|uniref:phosphatase PAP2 family protein n=1 Tax=Oricola sp. TaxID=1979950 RepID=UPI003BA94610
MTDRQNPFGFLAHPVTAAGLLTAWITLLLVFNGEPQWDLASSAWFFDSQACAASQAADGRRCLGFTVSVAEMPRAIREFLHPLPTILCLLVAAVLAVELRSGLRWRFPGIRLKTVLVTTLIIGPGLLVNGVLKAHWGRPRPWMTEEFGGWLPFVEAGTKTGYCASNCSFVSGEASTAGWLMCLALMLAIRRRRIFAALVAAVSIVMAAMRVVFGAHYLSDAILGYLSTIVIFSVLAVVSEWIAERRQRQSDACAQP